MPVAPYIQSYTININKTGSDGCGASVVDTGALIDTTLTIEGYCCMCGDGCGPDATPCSIALSCDNLYEGQCSADGGSETINIQNM